MSRLKKKYDDASEERGLNPGHDVLQIVTITVEPKVSESGEGGKTRVSSGGLGCWTCLMGPRYGEIECNEERFEPCQWGQAGDHGLG